MNPSPTALPADAATPAIAEVRRRRSPWLLSEVARMFVIGFPLYGLLALSATLVLTLIGPFLPAGLRKRFTRQLIYRAISFWMRTMENIGVLQVDFQAWETMRTLRGTVIAPNHPTVLDATQFLARVPQITCLMKKSILSNPFMGVLARLAGYLRNDHGPEFIRKGRDALLAGENLLIFPEGTRTIQPPVNRFKKGFALIATLAEAPIQTIFIDVPVLFLGKRWPLWRIPHLPVHFTVRVGKVFHPRPGQTAKALGDEIETYFREQLEATPEGVQKKPEAVAGNNP